MLAIAIVPESAPNSDSVFKWTKRISEDFRPSYSTHFSFGFMRDPKMFHDITLDSSVEFPNLFVLDTSTDHYYIPEVKVIPNFVTVFVLYSSRCNCLTLATLFCKHFFPQCVLHKLIKVDK